jgi:hypothetical protein
MPKAQKRMAVEIDLETGKVVSVTDGGRKVKSRSVKELRLQGKAVTNVSAHTLIVTHSSPGCVYYLVGGRYYLVCS